MFNRTNGQTSQVEKCSLAKTTLFLFPLWVNIYIIAKLKDVIHDLDSNSYYYRFPTDRNGNPHNLKINTDMLKNILKFREKVDAYLTFAIPVLQEYGYLESDYEYEQ